MATVFVIQENPRMDISAAVEYGQIRTILPPGDANYSIEANFDTILNAFDDFNPDQDFVLLMGDPIAIMLTGMAILFLHDGCEKIKVLKWNKHSNSYLELSFTIDPTIRG